MSRSPNRLPYAAALLIAVITGLLLLMRRSVQPKATSTGLTAPSVTQSEPLFQVVEERLLSPSMLALLAAGGGWLCWITAQALLLGSRYPVMPLILFTAGYVLFQPMLAFHERHWLNDIGKDSPFGESILASWKNSLRHHPRETAAVAGLALLALLLQVTTPGLSRPVVAAALLIPAVFWLGYVYKNALVGLIAAGFAAVSGWALALDSTSMTLALLFCLYSIALRYRWQTQSLVVIAAALIIGALVSPLVLYAALLIPLRVMLTGLDAGRRWVRLLAFVAIILAGALVILSAQPQDLPANPQYSLTEGLFTSLLMFNLTSDPNPQHGLVNRPVFEPAIAASFALGLLGIAWRLNARRRWSDAFLLLALVIALLPSSLLLEPPVRYPDLRRAAMALPAALVIAAFGASLLVRLLTERLGKAGVLIAAAVLIAVLIITASEARWHYLNQVLPIQNQVVGR